MNRILFLKIGIGEKIIIIFRYSGIDDGHLFSRTLDERIDEKPEDLIKIKILNEFIFLNRNL